MKSLHWVIIGIGIMTGICFLLSTIFSVVFFVGFIIVTICLGIAAGIGYLTVKVLPLQQGRYGIHKALLIPWLTVFILYVAIALLRHQQVDFLLTVPLLFVFSSIGGFMAYCVKTNKFLKSF